NRTDHVARANWRRRRRLQSRRSDGDARGDPDRVRRGGHRLHPWARSEKGALVRRLRRALAKQKVSRRRGAARARAHTHAGRCRAHPSARPTRGHARRFLHLGARRGLSVVAAPASPTPALASQAAYRALMDAFARPGPVRPLPPAAAAPSPLSATAAAIALALVDYETPVWLDARLAQSPPVADWIRLHAGARVTSDPSEAAFAFIADPAHVPAFDRFSLGTPDYPDRSATLVLQVEDFGSGQRLLLAGPGIAEVQS